MSRPDFRSSLRPVEMNRNDWSEGETGEREEVGLRVIEEERAADSEEGKVVLEASDGPAAQGRAPRRSGTPLAVRRTEDVGPGVDSSAAGPDRRAIPWISILMVIVLVVLVIGGVVAVTLSRPAPPKVEAAPAAPEEEAVVVEKDALTLEFEAFTDDGVRRAEEGRELLRKYAAATRFEEVMPLLRESDRDPEVLAKLWEPLGGIGRDMEDIKITFSFRAGRPCMEFVGMTDEDGYFLMLFVLEDGELKIDWRASEGVGDVAFAELAELETGREVLMRVIVSPSDFHTSAFPDSEFRSFLLTDASGLNLIWGYVPLGGELEERMGRLFNEHSALYAADFTPALATLRIQRTEEAGDRQYRITEMVGESWLQP